MGKSLGFYFLGFCLPFFEFYLRFIDSLFCFSIVIGVMEEGVPISNTDDFNSRIRL